MSDNLKITVEWNIEKAEEFYTLVKFTTMNQYHEKILGSGDAEWAKRTAKHYNLELPVVSV